MESLLTGACLVGRVKVKDSTKWAAYRAGIPATLAPWNATLVARGCDPLVLAGASDETDMVVIRFPDLDAIRAWYASAAYQALIPLRDAAADVVIVAYDVGGTAVTAPTA